MARLGLRLGRELGLPALRAVIVCQLIRPAQVSGAMPGRFIWHGTRWRRPPVLDVTVELLAQLARGDPALEFAVGTGRVALPLSARGTAVHGIELCRIW